MNGGRYRRPPTPRPLRDAAVDAMTGAVSRGVRDLLEVIPNPGQVIDRFIDGDVALVITADNVQAFDLAQDTHLGSTDADH